MNGELSGGKNGVSYERIGSETTGTKVSTIKPMPMNFTIADIVFAYCMLICGFLYWNLISINSLGLGVTVFSVILITVTAVYFRFSTLKQSKISLLFLGIIVLSALNFSLFDGIMIKCLNFIFPARADLGNHTSYQCGCCI